jgi:hypothetical protein
MSRSVESDLELGRTDVNKRRNVKTIPNLLSAKYCFEKAREVYLILRGLSQGPIHIRNSITRHIMVIAGMVQPLLFEVHIAKQVCDSKCGSKRCLYFFAYVKGIFASFFFFCKLFIQAVV